jgi:hypothetical protein
MASSPFGRHHRVAAERGVPVEARETLGTDETQKCDAVRWNSSPA